VVGVGILTPCTSRQLRYGVNCVLLKFPPAPPNLPVAGRRLRHSWNAAWSWAGSVGCDPVAPDPVVPDPDVPDPVVPDPDVPDPDVSVRRPNRAVP
jgi:hypothetical protein